MIKKLQAIATLFFLTFSFQTLSAQQVDVTWGKLNKPEKRALGYSVAGEVNDGIIVIKHGKKGRRYLEKYDNDEYGLVFSKEIDFNSDKYKKSKKTRLDYESVFIMNDAIVLFGTKYDKSNDKYNLFAIKYDFDGSTIGSWEKLSSISARKSRNTGNFTIVLSQDKTKFFVAKELPVEKKHRFLEYNFELFNADLEKIFEKNYPVEEGGSEVSGYKIHKNGYVFFMGANAIYSFSTAEDTEGDVKVNEYTIDLADKIITDRSFSFDNDGNVVVAGFYSSAARKKYGLAGIFYVKLDPESLEPALETTSEFSKEFLDIFLSKRQLRKGKGISTTYDMRYFMMKQDGGCMLIAENYFVTQHCTTDKNGFTRCTYSYHYNDLIVVNISPDGEIKHAHNILKYAASSNYANPLLSFSIIPAGNDVIIFYNDHYKNYLPGAKKIRPQPGYKKTVLAMVTVKDNGEVTKEALIRQKQLGLSIMPRRTAHVDNGIIMMGFYKRNVKFGKFVVTE